MERRFNVLLPEAVGQKLKALSVLRAVGQGADTVQLCVFPLFFADAGDGLLAGDGVRVQNAFAVVSIEDDGPTVAVVEEILADLHDARNVHRPRDDGRMALVISLRRDDAEDHPRRDAEQVAGHQHLSGQDHRMVQRQPDAGPVGQDIHHPAGRIEDIHAAQLHVGVVFHMGQLVGIPMADPIHGFGRADARFDLELDFLHEALILQHHALEQEDGLFGGAAPLCHRVQLFLRRFHGSIQPFLLSFRVERPAAEALDPAFQTADLPQHKAGRSRMSLIHFHVSSTSVGSGAVRVQ